MTTHGPNLADQEAEWFDGYEADGTRSPDEVEEDAYWDMLAELADRKDEDDG